MIGTVHVSEVSKNRVGEAIRTYLPNVVCVELDMERFKTLQAMREGGHFPYSGGEFARPNLGNLLSLEGILRWIQQKIGEEFGIMPGIEMATAIETAKNYHLDIALVDRPLRLTIERLKRALPFKEKIRLVGYLGAIALSIFLKPVGSYRLLGVFSDGRGIDMAALERGEGVDALLGQLRAEFPTIYRVLVGERDVIMASNITKLLERYDRVLVVVGLGHIGGMKKLFAQKGVRVEILGVGR
ncbi:MAG: TraB/GumN family protein [Candidatus Altiarchaeota archaeon]|nr:TraB/GumN family protein [Candidatus Altiarchaeota archaeon]